MIDYEISCRYYKDNDGDNFEIIFNDVTRIKNTEEKNAEFKYKTLFLSKIAHEFKNPIICIIELVEQLNELVVLNQTDYCNSLKDNLTQIKSLSHYLLILIKDLDYFSQQQLNKKANLDPSEIQIEDLFTFCTEIAKAILKKNKKEEKVKFITKIHRLKLIPNIITLDEIKVKQVLINLISNSIKFTNSGTISLEASTEEPGFIKFTVSDTGIGMNEDIKKNIFKPFHKLRGNSNLMGTGLGLSIVHDLTTILGKTVEFSSEYGKGSKFWFSIPMTLKDTQVHNQQDMIKKISSSTITDMVMNKNRSHSIDVNTSALINTTSNAQLSIFARHKGSQTSMETVKLPNVELSHPYKQDICSRLKLNLKQRCVSTTHEQNIKCLDDQEEKLSIQHNVDVDVVSALPTEYPMTLIIADDEAFIRQSTIRALNKIALQKDIQLHILEAEDGIEIIHLIYTKMMNGYFTKIDGIISDENMRFLSGRRTAEILKLLQNEKSFPSIPFLLVTAYNDIQPNSSLSGVFTKPLQKTGVEEIFQLLSTENQ